MRPTPPDSGTTATKLLPEPDKRLLGRPPLEAVVLDIRFLAEPESLSPEVGLRLKESIEGAGWPVERLEHIQQHAMQVQFGPDQAPNPVVSAQGIGWRLIPPDGTWVATVLPGQASLQSSLRSSCRQSAAAGLMARSVRTLATTPSSSASLLGT
jgi:hypothetical protein